jgi:hypothetical protein
VRYLTAVSLNDSSARWVAADQQMIDETGRHLLETQVVKPKKTNFTFSAGGVPMGSDVKFIRDPAFTARVVSETEVEFEGTVIRLSPLTRLIFERKNEVNASGAYAGPDWFTFEDEILSDRRRRIEEEPTED